MKYLGILVVILVLTLGACEKTPQAEIDMASAAYETAASNPDVILYAPDTLRAAWEKLESLQSETKSQARKTKLSRRYARALELARATKDEAERAVRDAARTKQHVKEDAATLLEGIATAIPELEGRLWAARRIRGLKLDPAVLNVADDARVAVVDARKDLAAGAFAAARAKAMTVQDRIVDSERMISEALRLAKKM